MTHLLAQDASPRLGKTLANFQSALIAKLHKKCRVLKLLRKLPEEFQAS